ncbi:MAG: DUF488 domain-containing protein [Mycobacterium sp.]|uniref:DUF488 domain-containing protein n=1 Tax=Mycobacterium gordonae TaxID=1778 RepID=A0A0Q2X4I2_MYCGO|nr:MULTISPECIES: DUF488 domain-containing protein [Mycobacterium]KQH76220.1 hypothetical protein AO501_00940 [Mycobacterium gordonae]MDP7732825.1 DUF488 domain-containing protein [Mycobacterium sp. TY813]PJE06615.1 MAG: DUF488 domain-containing protein [Mycobacterium sp.]
MAVALYTIGFTKKSAQRFFDLLRNSPATRLVDVRLNNVSQLAGFAKRDDLKFFLHELCDMDYAHHVELAPTQHMLDAYKKRDGTWAAYEAEFIALMQQRRIEDTVSTALLHNAVLLCSEDKPHHCHRRLVAEYLAQHWANVEIVHLL